MDHQAPVRSFPWERLPPELREMIFDTLSFGYQNKNDYFRVCCQCDEKTAVPSLPIALRPLPISYVCALGRFDATNQEFYTWFNDGVDRIFLLNATELEAFKEMRMVFL